MEKAVAPREEVTVVVARVAAVGVGAALRAVASRAAYWAASQVASEEEPAARETEPTAVEVAAAEVSLVATRADLGRRTLRAATHRRCSWQA